MTKPRITLALNTYDRHEPLLEGPPEHPDFELAVIEVNQSSPGRYGSDRHERFLSTFEFDACELSLSSYLVAVDRGLPVRAIPVFPRRLFSQSQMYKNMASGIEGPNGLEGKRVGLRSYQTTLSVLAKGDLEHVYGIPWKSITWVTAREEAIDVALPADVKIESVEGVAQIDAALVSGDIAAYFGPTPPLSFVQGNPKVGRLFADSRAEEERYLREEGYFPIMHVLALKQELAERYPQLPTALFEIYEQSRQLARQRWSDPNWSLLIWGRHELERQTAMCGFDPWQNGLDPNRKNLERFVTYSYEQGLTRRRLAPEELFLID